LYFIYFDDDNNGLCEGEIGEVTEYVRLCDKVYKKIVEAGLKEEFDELCHYLKEA